MNSSTYHFRIVRPGLEGKHCRDVEGGIYRAVAGVTVHLGPNGFGSAICSYLDCYNKKIGHQMASGRYKKAPKPIPDDLAIDKAPTAAEIAQGIAEQLWEDQVCMWQDRYEQRKLDREPPDWTASADLYLSGDRKLVPA